MGEMSDMARFGMQTRIIVGQKGNGERIFADGRPDYDPPANTLDRCPSCGYHAFNGVECFDCGYKPKGGVQ
jgi:hypothetical protein